MAGQLILGHHGYSMGYIPGIYRPLDGTPQNGMGHYTIDSVKSAATVIAVIETAKSFGAGVSFMCHPSLLDTTGKITTAVLGEILKYIAAERDAGRIEVMTAGGLTLSDSSHSRRFNMVVNGSFAQGLTGWAGVKGWTAVAGGAAGSNTAGIMSRTLSITNLAWACGAVWELSALFTAGASDVVVRVTVEDSTTSANVVNTRTVTVPGGTTLRVRTQITIPATGTTGLRFKAGRVSGDTVNMTGVRFNAI